MLNFCNRNQVNDFEIGILIITAILFNLPILIILLHFIPKYVFKWYKCLDINDQHCVCAFNIIAY